ncbi:MAG: A/G-specific adenine glycosylase [Bacteroidota bacterium]
MERSSFAERLIDWFSVHKRPLPWRENSDPYRVWLSEIILQQTRVEQGKPYWERFVDTFPTVVDLANAEEQTILRLWQGLGYYSRARNLHTTAIMVRDQYHGKFPSTYSELLKLKGIGPYTAAAIASICFDEPQPVVDGNVYRFISRYAGIYEDIANPKTRKIFEAYLAPKIKRTKPGEFNQALMEYGATMCTPSSPACIVCGFQVDCHAQALGHQSQLPVKLKKTKVRERPITYLVFKQRENWFAKQRQDKDIWQGLYDFATIEGPIETEDVLKKVSSWLGTQHFIISEISEPFTHLLSHQRIKATFYLIEVTDSSVHVNLPGNNQIKAYSTEELLNLPKPKLIVNYLERLGYKE